MKNIIIILIVSALFQSCGKPSGQGSNTPVQESITGKEELTLNEVALKEKLQIKGEYLQKDLVTELSRFPNYDQDLLKKLDHHLNIQCIQQSGMCYITGKIK